MSLAQKLSSVKNPPPSQVCWVEAGRACPTGAGIFCFSTKKAELMFDSLNRLMASTSASGLGRRRLSRRCVV